MYQDFFSKNDDYLNDFKQKVANQKIATLEERRTELARSRNNFLGTFAGIALAGVVGWFVLAPQYAETEKEIPIIRRPQTAVKIKPENPGGMDIPNQDKNVYNIVEKKEVDNTVVENLLPKPETPKLPDIVPEVSDVDVNANNLDQIVDEVSAEKALEKTAEIIMFRLNRRICWPIRLRLNRQRRKKPLHLRQKQPKKLLLLLRLLQAAGKFSLSLPKTKQL